MVNESVHEMVEEASSFGSAGVLVIAVFALFTSFGGAASAVAGLSLGLLTYLAGAHVLDFEAPFLASLLVATVAYVGVALVARETTVLAPAGSDGAGE
jgi:hypothetical protein